MNKDAPRVQTYIAVKAGSTYDPSETTGLAHYLEHMMFKGSDEIATVNWEEEKVLLETISDLYEQHKATDDPEEKKAIYRKIDSVSNVAAQFAAANEYDKMVSSIGASGTNAYTTHERTVYMNNVPSNELDKWMQLESERFSQLVLRLFHTELETVYEEFNMYQDYDWAKADETLLENLFPKHPYGQQTTIGKPEHLKNPSMVNIHNYHDTYYVPNNMAVCLSGDFDMEETIKMIDEHFGKLKPNDNLKENVLPKEDPITAPVIKEVLGPDEESLTFAYRFDGYNSTDRKYVTMIDYMLNNSKAGLIDLDLVQSQKVLSAGCNTTFLKDYGYHEFMGRPREGQTLEEVRDLILNEIEKIKKGEFEDWLPEAVVNNMKLSRMRSVESNSRAHTFAVNFTNESTWKDYLEFLNDLSMITKEEIVKFAKEHYKDNYVCVFKRTGKDENIVKVEKPEMTPVDINRELESEFFKNFKEIKTEEIQPVFVDFKKEISTKKLGDIQYDYIKNKTNKLFSLYYVFDMGRDNMRELSLAFSYLKYLGTDKYTPEDIQKEFYKLGLNFGVSAEDNRSYVYFSGLEDNFEKGIELFEHLLANCKPDQAKYDDKVKDILKNRANNKLDKGSILWGGLYNYGKFGKFSPFTNKFTEEELINYDINKLTDLIHDVSSYKHKMFLYAQMDQDAAGKIIEKYHKVPGTLKDYPQPVKFPELNIDQNQVYFVNYDMVQTNIVMLTKDVPFDMTLMPQAKIFNEYFGGGLSSIVFQEIRESKALAYSAFAAYSQPDKKDKSYYTYGFVGTQPDKMKIATDALLELMNDMPKAEKQFNAAKESIIKKYQTSRLIKSSAYWTYLSNMDMGIDYDVRENIYNSVQKSTLDDLGRFFDDHIKDKKYTFLVIGNKKDIDFNVLGKLGPVKELTLEEIFGY